MKNITLISLFLWTSIPVFSQRPDQPTGNGVITGLLQDTITKQGVEFGSIAIYSSRDSTLLTGVMSDEAGNFKMEGLRYGKFYLKIKSLGFKEKIISPVILTPESPTWNAGIIWLSTGVALNEIEVVEYTEVLETNLDKKIINVEKDLTSTGGTALDLMKNVPSVTVDVDGNVSLRGNANVRILIDGRPSTMDPSTMLQQLPAGMVKQIEVITNPSAKYDPDGVTGIINIVTKKSNRTGFNGTFQGNIGSGSTVPGGGMENFTINKYSFNTNLNYKFKKWNIFGGYDGRSNVRWNTGSTTRDLFAADSVNTVEQTSGKMRPSVNHSVKAGFDWQPNDQNILTISGNLRTEKGSGDETINYYEYYDNYNFISNYDRIILQHNDELNYDVNADYKKTFAKKGRELSASASWSSNTRENTNSIAENYYLADDTPTGQTPLNEYITELSGNNQITAQVDFVEPLKEKWGRVETGLKLITRDVYQDLNVSTNNTPNHAVIDDATRTNRFEYDDQLYSAYVIYGNAYKKLKYQGGLRFEQAVTHSRQVSLNTDYYRDFYNFFPSAHLRYELTDKQELSLSYSKRIQRPGLRQLNPYPDYTDKLNLRVGNPYLFPEYTHSFEAGHSYAQRGVVLSSTLFYRYTNNMIFRYKTVDPATGVSRIEQVNMGQNESFGFEWIYNQPFTKWLRMNSNFSTFYTIIHADKTLQTQQSENFAYTARVMLNISSPGKLEWQISGNYRSPSITPQGLMKPMYFVDLGFKRDFFNKKATISFRLSDVFNMQRFAMNMKSSAFGSSMYHKWESRVANLTFQYNINPGNTEKKDRKRPDQGNGDGMDFGM